MTNVHLVDVSAIVRLSDPDVAAAVMPLLIDGLAATCGVVELALLGRITDVETRTEIAATRLTAFRWLPTTDEDLRRALDVQETLLSDGNPSVSLSTLVAAAVAQRHGVVVMHCDPAYDRIVNVTGQPARWIGPEVSGPATTGGPPHRGRRRGSAANLAAFLAATRGIHCRPTIAGGSWRATTSCRSTSPPHYALAGLSKANDGARPWNKSSPTSVRDFGRRL
jgi:predicted nucleic acid-binding protein